jgi:hypothetical protein
MHTILVGGPCAQALLGPLDLAKEGVGSEHCHYGGEAGEGT